MNEDNCGREIRTDRLCLRRFSLEDLDAYAGIMGDYEVANGFLRAKVTPANKQKNL
jgi:hypothetical protein